MRGSVKKRPSGWSIVYDLPKKWDEKRQVFVRNQKWERVPPPNNRKHAEKLLAERLSRLNRGDIFEPTKMLLEEYKNLWMERYAEVEGIAVSTLSQYEYLFRVHIIPALGQMELMKIGSEDLQMFKASKLKTGLSPQTVKHMTRLIRQMLTHAVDWGYIQKNPALRVKHPTVIRREMDAFSPQETSQMLRSVSGQWYCLILVAVTTGLRRGELLSAKWANVDWEGGRYIVKETLHESKDGIPIFGAPKTRTSNASVDLTPACISALKQHRMAQSEDRLAAGQDYQDFDLIFSTSIGTPFSPSNVVRRVFHPALKRAGLRRIRFHDLRHTCASLLIAQGENPKYVQRQLRHSSIQITFDCYGHLFPEVGQEAVRRLDVALKLEA